MIRKEIRIEGIVQGVGFRPFIYSLANKDGLNGFVLNNTEGVIIEAEGKRNDVDRFILDIKQEAPPLSRIGKIRVKRLPLAGYNTFAIKPSFSARRTAGKFVLISPDIATCDKCIEELFNPNDRRFGYPFINCTNCGPRFTIIQDIPYDRPKTTMEKFSMCPRCREEYEDPLNRRFHAQLNACPECGPDVRLVQSASGGSGLRVKSKGEKAIEKAARLLQQGKIVAVKGLGGFHLACDATNQAAVANLRRKKFREKKAFAMMARDIQSIQGFCEVSEFEEKVLLSPRRPIVLLKSKTGDNEAGKTKIAPNVAPNQKCYGVMLPYTPLHHLLLDKLSESQIKSAPTNSGGNSQPPVLVMTSGNLKDEPIIYKDRDAFAELGKNADYFLTHNREIHIRCDDSVVRAFQESEIMVRRSRGYVPEPIELPFIMQKQAFALQNCHILACGAEQKNTFCITKDNYAFLSPYIGDLENLETLQAFEQGLEHFKNLFSISPTVIAYDLHPEYLSTKYAKQNYQQVEARASTYPKLKRGLQPTHNHQLIGIQHHHAHIASCMADNGLTGKVIGVAFDGLGYGTDGNLWGGEFLVAEYSNFKRAGHLQYIPMPGGSAAIKEPWRMAASYLYHIYGNDLPGVEFTKKTMLTDNTDSHGFNFSYSMDIEKWKVLKNLIDYKINSPLTSSIGRLFDAVSSLLGICGFSSYEGQAAIELESVASRLHRDFQRDFQQEDEKSSGNQDWEVLPTSSYDYEIVGNIIQPDKIFLNIIEDLKNKVPIEIISGRFHITVADMIVKMCLKIREDFHLNRVALSGGVFQNILLLEQAVNQLRDEGFKVYIPHRVPVNDGGISLGQAAIAASKIKN